MIFFARPLRPACLPRKTCPGPKLFLSALIILILTVLAPGCKTFEPESDPGITLMLPTAFSIDPKGVQTIEKWWTAFGSEELNTLIETALENNFDIQTLQARVLQAKAAVDKETAGFFPTLDFSLGGSKQGTQTKSTASASSNYDGDHSFDTSLTSSYTLDVWGKLKADSKAVFLEYQASLEDLRSRSLNLSSDIAETWIDIISTREKILLLKKQVESNQTLLQLQKLRFTNGKADALAVSQQTTALAEARSQIPLLEKQERLSLNTLILLTGQTAFKIPEVNDQTMPEPIPLPSLGLPSDLLKKRPDIKAALFRLFSSQWEISSAKADLLPSFQLTANALFSSGELDLLFQNWVATLTASILGPIFDGGFQRAEVDRVTAVAKEQLTLYAKTVATAVREVEDSLISLEKQQQYIDLLKEELSVAQLTLIDAQVQYQNGQSSYLEYLNTWTSIEQLERQIVGERATYIKDRIGLHRALGWQAGTL
ncbi:MAG: efflux transporter outer membrane subunit [Desulfotignum sp.]|nr:efflux transporter outer membrane subunit [Desulfotignum sp.]MCF8090659.1 efflux transporter outer membrane subunit [Desulfotignum sp.]